MTISKMMAHMMASMTSMMANPIAKSCERVSKSPVDSSINRATLVEVDEVEGPVSAVAEEVLLGLEAEAMLWHPQVVQPKRRHQSYHQIPDTIVETTTIASEDVALHYHE